MSVPGGAATAQALTLTPNGRAKVNTFTSAEQYKLPDILPSTADRLHHHDNPIGTMTSLNAGSTALHPTSHTQRNSTAKLAWSHDHLEQSEIPLSELIQHEFRLLQSRSAAYTNET